MASLAVSLTAFVDFAAATGTAKAGKVQKVKKQLQTGGFDYWLPLRNAIVSLHHENRPAVTLSRVLDGLDERKIGNYTQCIAGYKQWLGRKHPEPFVGRNRGLWVTGDLTVRVNPELIVHTGTQRTAVKLYFSAPPISRARVDLAQYLIRKVVGQQVHPAVLDVRRAKLHVGSLRASKAVDALLEGEARLFVSMWEAI